MTGVRTTCCYCGVGCGVVVAGDGSVRGDPAHPANHGRLCSKGAALGQTLDDADRLLHPEIDGARADWDTALDLVAGEFRRTIAAHGPDSVALYVSGQCLTEDYYVANKLMKGFIGSGNIDSNSRLCMASSVAGHVRAFGEDIVPGVYEDFDEADLVLLVGSNTAWCHPVLHQRLLAARAARGTRIVVIDPRRSATAESADLHLPVAGDTDIALFAGLLAHLDRAGAIDRAWTARHASGLAQALAAAAEFADPDRVAGICGVDPETVATLFDWFAATERVMTVYSQGVNQSACGTDKVSAILNCHLATARIGRPGMGPFSLTGQPNAMGGREVGGMANQLAAHLRFDDPADRAALQSFWSSPTLPPRPGLKAIELFDAVADGRVRALWIIATNPAASLPRAGQVRRALAACPFVVASDCWPTDTTALARVVLPAAGWGEKDGTVTNSERRILAPARVPGGAGRGAAGLVDAGAGGPADGVRRGLRLGRSGRGVPRTRGAVRRRRRRRAGVRHLAPGRAGRCRLRRAAPGGVAAARAGRGGGRTAVRRGRVSDPGRAGAADAGACRRPLAQPAPGASGLAAPAPSGRGPG